MNSNHVRMPFLTFLASFLCVSILPVLSLCTSMAFFLAATLRFQMNCLEFPSRRPPTHLASQRCLVMFASKTCLEQILPNMTFCSERGACLRNLFLDFFISHFGPLLIFRATLWSLPTSFCLLRSCRRCCRRCLLPRLLPLALVVQVSSAVAFPPLCHS